MHTSIYEFVAALSASNATIKLTVSTILSHHSLTVVCGTIPLQIGFLVAFSQLLPAHTVTLFRGIISMRVPRFPLLYICLVTFLATTPLLSSASFFLAMHGFVVSWTYLRFYKNVFPDLESASSAHRGDASETFAFAEFFPGPLKPLVRGLSDVVFSILVAVRVCRPFSAGDLSAASAGRSHDGLSRGVPGARAEAERRRALALRALDQRLQAATAAAATSKSASPPGPTGPAVHTQPAAAKATMSSQAGEVLGGTNYNPDHEADRS